MKESFSRAATLLDYSYNYITRRSRMGPQILVATRVRSSTATFLCETFLLQKTGLIQKL